MQIFCHFLRKNVTFFILSLIEKTAARIRPTARTVGRNGVGEFEADIEECQTRHEFLLLTVCLHDRREDALQRESFAHVGEHDHAKRFTSGRRVISQAIIAVCPDNKIRAVVIGPVQQEFVTQFRC